MAEKGGRRVWNPGLAAGVQSRWALWKVQEKKKPKKQQSLDWGRDIQSHEEKARRAAWGIPLR